VASAPLQTHLAALADGLTGIAGAGVTLSWVGGGSMLDTHGRALGFGWSRIAPCMPGEV